MQKKKNKGFTLIEIIGTIAIIAIISIIVVPIVINSLETSKNKTKDITIMSIKNAGSSYSKEFSENINWKLDEFDNKLACINIDSLIDKGYIKENESITEVKDDKIIQASEKNGNLDIEVVDTNKCNAGKIEIPPNPNMTKIKNIKLTPSFQTITVDVETEDNSKINKYFYRIGSGNFQESTNSSYTFTDLTVNTSYKIYVYVMNDINVKSFTVDEKTKTLLPKSTLVVNTNEGIWNGQTTNQTIKKNYNETQDIPLPTRIGYTFNAWDLKNESGQANGKMSNLTGAATYTYGIKDSQTDTLTAKWNINSSTLVINPNGGTWNGQTTSQTIKKNYNETQDIPIPNRTGYTFDYWKRTNTYGTMNTVSGPATYTYGSTKNVTDTLTANWTANTATLIVNPNGGIWNNKTNSSTIVETIGSSISVPIPTKTGSIFTGWRRTNTYGTITSLTAPATYTYGQIAEVTDTLTATWQSYVARIGSTYYTSIQAAFNAVPANNVRTDVYLLISTTESPILTANKYVTLNFSGNTMYGSITNSGNLSLLGGTITNTSGNGVVNNSASTLTISSTNVSGYVNGVTTNTIKNSGTIYITGSSYVTSTSNSPGGSLIYNLNGTISADSGTIKNNVSGCGICTPDGYSSTISLSGSANVTITGSWCSAVQIGGGGSLTISGNASINGALWLKSANFNMSGGKIIGSTNDTSWLIQFRNATMTLSGTASITAPYTAVSLYDTVTLNVYDSAVISGTTGINTSNSNYRKNINMYGGTIIGKGTGNAMFLSNSGYEGYDTLNLHNGTIRFDGTVKGSGYGYAIYNQRQRLNFYGGSVTAASGGCAILNYTTSYLYRSGGYIQGGYSCTE